MQRSPLTPSDCDLRSEQFLPLCAAHWRDHALAFDSNAEAFRAAVLLAMASWSQVPCASLPNDDAALAVMAGLGRTKRSIVSDRCNGTTCDRKYRASDDRIYGAIL